MDERNKDRGRQGEEGDSKKAMEGGELRQGEGRSEEEREKRW